MSRFSAYFLVGPTASGKSAVSAEIARRTGALVVSADSMLVYRGMDVGTAKPTAEEREGVDLRCIDIVAPDEAFSAGRWLETAAEAFAEAEAAGRDVIVVGGTGFYVSALLHGIDAPPPNPDRREALDAIAGSEGGAATLREMAEALSPGSTAGIDAANPRRLVRLVEILEAGGAEKFRANSGSAPDLTPRDNDAAPPSPTPLAGLWFDPEELADRIEKRARAMFDGGALQRETAAIAAAHPTFEQSTAGAGIGYAEALALIRGEISESEAIDRVAARTRRLAKKQRTWWRHQYPVEWIPGPREAADIPRAAEAVMEVWRKNGRIPVAIGAS